MVRQKLCIISVSGANFLSKIRELDAFLSFIKPITSRFKPELGLGVFLD